MGEKTGKAGLAVPEGVAKKRALRRAKKRDNTREDILAAARAVVLEKGVAGATLEAVANEAGMSKTALYYYFESKDAILFELIFEIMSGLSAAIHHAVEKQTDGGAALEALIGTTLATFQHSLDDFRLAYLLGQVTSPGTVNVSPEQIERVRPLNALAYAGTADRLNASTPNRANVDPRLIAFLAQTAAIGVLTMKGMVESVNDPLIYSDQQMSDALSSIFGVAAEPASNS